MPHATRRPARAAFALAAALLLLPALAACTRDAAGPGADAAGARDSHDPAARIEDDVHALAHDRMQGRETGTPGFDLAAEHVAKRFAGAGLQPGGEDGGWFQRVPLLRASLVPEGARLQVRLGDDATTLAFQDQFLPMANFNQAQATVDAPAVYVGQAIHAPGLGHDDFAGLDLQGKVAVILGGAPGRFDDTRRAFHGSMAEKLRSVSERGAVGAVFVSTAADEARSPWERSAAGWDRPTMRLRDADGRGIDTFPGLRVVARVRAAAADTLFAGGELSAAQLADRARDQAGGFDLPVRVAMAVQTRVEPLDSRNVVGLLPGGDPALAREYVVHTAHLDHVGLGLEVDGDGIYNGALDNALGVAIMTEAARILASADAPPRRPQLFVALTGEEQGLLGSQWFARNPTVGEGGALVANINIDMPVLTAPSRDVVPIGAEHSTLAAVVDTAAREVGVKVSPDPFPEEAVFVRSDQFSFVREGIPAVYLDGGIEPVDADRDPKVSATWFMRNCYHRPCDQADLPIQYGDALRMARLSAAIARGIAGADDRPAWNEGDFFGERFGAARP